MLGGFGVGVGEDGFAVSVEGLWVGLGVGRVFFCIL